MKLTIIAALSLAVGFLLAYGAFKTAEQIAKQQNQRIEALE